MSLNIVNKTTGALSQVAGNADDSGIGNLNSLTTTDKSSLVNAVNELKSGLTNSVKFTHKGAFIGNTTTTITLAPKFRGVLVFAGINNATTGMYILAENTSGNSVSIIGVKSTSDFTITYDSGDNITVANGTTQDAIYAIFSFA